MASERLTRISRRDILLKTYELYMARYNAIFPTVYIGLNFYFGAIFLLLGGAGVVVRGAFTIPQSIPTYISGILVLAAGLLVCGVSRFGYRGFQHSYEPWLRTVTTLMKLERELDLITFRGRKSEKPGLDTEPIVFPDFVADYVKFSNSADFVEAKLKKGYGKTAKLLFDSAFWIGIILSCIGIFVTGMEAFRQFWECRYWWD